MKIPRNYFYFKVINTQFLLFKDYIITIKLMKKRRDEFEDQMREMSRAAKGKIKRDC